tara:strand:+ start:247 stop:1584 length:1338 start_codon:yes stop_codon:yes gene_type:complete
MCKLLVLGVFIFFVGLPTITLAKDDIVSNSIPRSALNLSSCSNELGMKSFKGGRAVGVKFKNITPDVISVNWLSFKGRRISYGQIKPGKSMLMKTYHNHPWLISKNNGQCIVIGKFSQNGTWYLRKTTHKTSAQEIETTPYQRKFTNLATAFNKLSLKKRKKIQLKLKILNFYSSTIDGIFGQNTASAIRYYADSDNFELDKLSFFDPETILNSLISGTSNEGFLTSSVLYNWQTSSWFTDINDQVKKRNRSWFLDLPPKTIFNVLMAPHNCPTNWRSFKGQPNSINPNYAKALSLWKENMEELLRDFPPNIIKHCSTENYLIKLSDMTNHPLNTKYVGRVVGTLFIQDLLKEGKGIVSAIFESDIDAKKITGAKILNENLQEVCNVQFIDPKSVIINCKNFGLIPASFKLLGNTYQLFGKNERFSIFATNLNLADAQKKHADLF